jgi:hypothetical protein
MAALAKTLNFLICGEDIIDLVGKHTLAHDRILAGC